MKFGADLCTGTLCSYFIFMISNIIIKYLVYCSTTASIPIKSYSPELMVSPFYEDYPLGFAASDFSEPLKTTSLVDLFAKQHSVVIGPGLGQYPEIQETVFILISTARRANKTSVTTE